MATDDTTTKAIAANLTAMNVMLFEARELSIEAVKCIQQGRRNEAIGCTGGLKELLQQSAALYAAAIALHRTAKLKGE
jgi:hypothetical protein